MEIADVHTDAEVYLDPSLLSPRQLPWQREGNVLHVSSIRATK
jgi:hypothetical protein